MHNDEADIDGVVGVCVSARKSAGREHKEEREGERAPESQELCEPSANVDAMAEGSIPPHIANLCQILQSCLSPQQQVIKAAEEQLKQLEKTQGQASNLLQVCHT